MPIPFRKLFSVGADDIGQLAGWPFHHGSVTSGRDSVSSGLTVL
jgi:hypothetical protein